MTEPNIVVLVLDTVRKDVFDECAVNIRERADLSFERAYAPSSWTVPSHASLFTGSLVHEHGIHAHNIDYRKLSVEDTFLGPLDHRTIGVSTNSFLSPRFGFDRLFDEFAHFHGNEELLPGGIDTASFMEQSVATGASQYIQYLKTAAAESALVPSLTNAAYMKLNNAVLRRPISRIGDYGARTALQTGLKRGNGSEPFFLFANLVDAHAPHEVLRRYETDVPASWTSREHDVWEVNNQGIDQFPEYLNRFAELYGCAVEYLDRRVLAFVDALQKRTNRETTIIVTADHGEELGRENERTLGHKIPSAAVAHVPLEVINPPSSWKRGTVTDVVSLLDIGVLVHSAVENTNPQIFREMAPVERIGDPHPPDERTEFWNRAIRTVFTANEAYEWDTNGAQNRYEVTTSTEHLVDKGIEVPERYQVQFTGDLGTAKNEAEAAGSNLDDEVGDRTRERLEDLGYM